KEASTSAAATPIRRRRCMKCCGWTVSVVLLLAAACVVLFFSVFRVKDPIIRLNNVIVNRLDLLNTVTTPPPRRNITVVADVSVKNPNYGSFRYPITRTSIFYRGAVIGDARGPPGMSRSHETTRMNITVDVNVDRVMSQPDLGSDIGSGLMTMGSFTRVGGRMEVLVLKKPVTITLNCTVTINITSQGIEQQNCKQKVQI
ncbi:hypothetical protein M569_06698, partial [Genlisea aurea]